jgi:hypothetical protein
MKVIDEGSIERRISRYSHSRSLRVLLNWGARGGSGFKGPLPGPGEARPSQAENAVGRAPQC